MKDDRVVQFLALNQETLDRGSDWECWHRLVELVEAWRSKAFYQQENTNDKVHVFLKVEDSGSNEKLVLQVFLLSSVVLPLSQGPPRPDFRNGLVGLVLVGGFSHRVGACRLVFASGWFSLVTRWDLCGPLDYPIKVGTHLGWDGIISRWDLK